MFFWITRPKKSKVISILVLHQANSSWRRNTFISPATLSMNYEYPLAIYLPILNAFNYVILFTNINLFFSFPFINYYFFIISYLIISNINKNVRTKVVNLLSYFKNQKIQCHDSSDFLIKFLISLIQSENKRCNFELILISNKMR